MNERRTRERKKSFLQGRLYFNHRRSSVDCLIRDLSATGARVKFSDAVATPDILELHIPSKNETFLAHTSWRQGDELGLSFGHDESADAVNSAGESPNLAGRVQALETELIALRRMFTELRAEMKRLKHAGAE